MFPSPHRVMHVLEQHLAEDDELLTARREYRGHTGDWGGLSSPSTPMGVMSVDSTCVSTFVINIWII